MVRTTEKRCRFTHCAAPATVPQRERAGWWLCDYHASLDRPTSGHALIEARSARQARRFAPWAAVVVKVEGGYMAFESARDAEVWGGQS